jgi:LmbE family N-acetylglucosaminyl deacetylase
MIVPLVPEEEWSRALTALPIWDPQPAPLLVLAPHPDDETLGAGGFIKSQCLRGAPVVVVAVTDGENAYGLDPRLGQVRRSEQTSALGALGVSSNNIVRLKLPDSDVASHESQLVRQLLPFVGERTHILAPWRGDFHPDHEACGRAAEQVANQTGAKLTSYFFWSWHRGTVELLRDLTLRLFPLDRQLLQSKAEALGCHRSQLEHVSGEPILPESLLAPARRPFEVFCPL